jgi:hypothetical protein
MFLDIIFIHKLIYEPTNQVRIFFLFHDHR